MGAAPIEVRGHRVLIVDDLRFRRHDATAVSAIVNAGAGEVRDGGLVPYGCVRA
jgi:hypothetical protein